MKIRTAALIAAIAGPSLMTLPADARLRFEEFLIGGTANENLFFEFSAESVDDFGPNTALLVIDGNPGNEGVITNALTLDLFPTGTGNSFPGNDLFFVQPIPVSGSQPSNVLPPNIIDYTPIPSTDTFFTGGGVDFFDNLPSASITVALVDGFDIGVTPVNSDIDDNNDGTANASLPFTFVHDAVTLLDSSNNLADQFNNGATPAWTGVGYADDFEAIGGTIPGGSFTFIDQRFDENVGVSPDGPDGFFRDTTGRAAAFDVNVNDNGLDGVTSTPDDADVFEFDGSGSGTEEVVTINDSGQIVRTLIPSDTDPVTAGDQFPANLTPGSANTITIDPTTQFGDVLPDPSPPDASPLIAILNSGDDIIAPTGLRIAGTSFENEAPIDVPIIDEAVDGEGSSLDGDSSTDEFFVGAISELLFGGVDLDGDDNINDIVPIGYVDTSTNSATGRFRAEGPFEEDGVTLIEPPLGDNDTVSLTVIDIDNTSDQFIFEGPDNILGTADDVAVDGIDAVVDSTQSSADAGDLGFNTVWQDTREFVPQAGLADPSLIGVTDLDVLNFNSVATPQDGRDGNNLFISQDTEGDLITTFDEVDLTDLTGVQFSMLLGANLSGYEREDVFKVELDLTTSDGTTTETIVDLEALSGGVDLIDVLANLTEPDPSTDQLSQVVFDIPDEVLAATVRIITNNSSGGEIMVFDNILFTASGNTSGLFGDFDTNGVLELDDLELLYDEVALGNNPEAFDLSFEGDVDGSDLAIWVETLFGSALGDLDLDGDVDIVDFGTFAANFGTSVSDYGLGDLDGDGDNDIVDFGTFAAGFGFGVDLTTEELALFESFSASVTSTIPEPTSLALLSLGGLAALRRRRA